MAYNDVPKSTTYDMDPVMELIITDMIPCPEIGILKIPVQPACTRTEIHEYLPREKYFWNSKSNCEFDFPLSVCIDVENVFIVWLYFL